MADVFISYKSDDRDRVQALVESLRRAGLSVWWDRDIPPAAAWEASITEALHRARCVIVCWTDQAVHPEFGRKVQVEAREALDQGKLLQVMLQNVKPPLFFRQSQALDLSGWRGDPGNATFQQLAQASRDIVAGRAPALPELTQRAPRRGAGLVIVAVLALVLAGAGAGYALLHQPDGAAKPASEIADAGQKPPQETSPPVQQPPAHQITTTAPPPAPVQAAANPPPTATVQHRAAPHPAYSGRGYMAELDNCTLLDGGAECTVYVTSQGHMTWPFNNRAYLADSNGGANHVVEMTIGGETVSVTNLGYRIVYENIEGGVRTRIVYRFAGTVTPADTQALIIGVDAVLSNHNVPLSPIPWR